MLHYAAANGHEECVAWLIKRGCKVSTSQRNFKHPSFLDFIRFSDDSP
jgi:hypothetical protein